MTDVERLARLLPVDTLLAILPAIDVDAEQAEFSGAGVAESMWRAGGDGGHGAQPLSRGLTRK